MTDTATKAVQAVKQILNNLGDSDFVVKYGGEAVKALADFAPDMAVDIFKIMEGRVPYQRDLDIIEGAFRA